jgi:type I restriction enzyme S subunit
VIVSAPDGWRAGQLGDFIELKRGYDLPSRERRDGPFPIVSSSGPSGTHVEAKVRGPGVVTGRYGTIGQVFFVEGDYWPLNTALYVRDFKGSDPRFVSYFLRSIDFNKYVDKAAVPGVNRNHVHLEEVAFPPLDEQRRIAAVLGALDDKIELNRKMNRTLEEMAQAIFKSWFIDFDGHDDLVDSEIGPVPRGWEVGTIADLASIENAAVLPARGAEETWEHYSLPAFDSGRMPSMELGSSIKSNKFRVPAPVVLVSKLNPHIPRVWLPAVRNVQRAVCSTEFVPLVPKAPPARSYLYRYFASPACLREITSRVGGTTGSHQRVKPSDLLALPSVIPPRFTLLAFDQIVQPLHARVQSCIDASRTLADLRDTLLPKLISGELRVPEAEELVEAVS